MLSVVLCDDPLEVFRIYSFLQAIKSFQRVQSIDKKQTKLVEGERLLLFIRYLNTLKVYTRRRRIHG